MKLQTQIPIKPLANPIDYNSKLLLLGSCFSEHMGNKLAYYKFKSVQNPFGILFHPKAIVTLIDRAVSEKKYTDQEVFFNNERWHCFDAHSVLSNGFKTSVVTELNLNLERTLQQLKVATHVVITLGTAWVYNHVASGATVANCHKFPQANFTKKLLSVTEIEKALQQIITTVQSVNDNVQVIFTVSPVRHLKDGFVENMRSKSHLIAAIHNVVDKVETAYFPSYELMMDELRDYRFYSSDMIHPNDVAIDYIWEKFCEVNITSTAQKTMKKVDAIQKGLQHKPFNEEAKEHQQFLNSLHEKIKELEKEFDFMEF